MRISHNTRFAKVRDNDGYGYATDRILNSLQHLGHDVKTNDPTAEAAFWFDQPQHWEWRNNSQYRIGYHPWESTLLMPDWPVKLNDCDEVWTPSPLIAQWYEEYNGITKPIHVYEHGIDPAWEIKPRKVTERLRFLHVGGEAYRKDLPLTLKAFRTAFEGQDDVEILSKIGASGWNINNPHSMVQTLSGKLPLDEQIALHHDRHVFVYPSWGEGFGFNPFQAMATGMPAIMTADWAPYKRFVDPNLTVKTSFADSPWPTVHPGKMFKPDFDDLVEKFRYVYDNYDSCYEFAQSQAPLIHEEYNWDTVTKTTFESLEKRLH
jgi:glycosyltransferase involved in cell wall biosynthesis